MANAPGAGTGAMTACSCMRLITCMAITRRSSDSSIARTAWPRRHPRRRLQPSRSGRELSQVLQSAVLQHARQDRLGRSAQLRRADSHGARDFVIGTRVLDSRVSSRRLAPRRDAIHVRCSEPHIIAEIIAQSRAPPAPRRSSSSPKTNPAKRTSDAACERAGLGSTPCGTTTFITPQSRAHRQPRRLLPRLHAVAHRNSSRASAMDSCIRASGTTGSRQPRGSTRAACRRTPHRLHPEPRSGRQHVHRRARACNRFTCPLSRADGADAACAADAAPLHGQEFACVESLHVLCGSPTQSSDSSCTRGDASSSGSFARTQMMRLRRSSPDPRAEATFSIRKLDWREAEAKAAPALLFHRELIAVANRRSGHLAQSGGTYWKARR